MCCKKPIKKYIKKKKHYKQRQSSCNIPNFKLKNYFSINITPFNGSINQNLIFSQTFFAGPPLVAVRSWSDGLQKVDLRFIS